jgi:hypothetical protein
VGLKLNGTYQLLAYIDNFNLLGDNIDTTKKNIETFVSASKEMYVYLEAKTEESKCMLLPRHQNAGQNRYIKVSIR